MGIKEILEKYDDPTFKTFDESEVNSELNRIPGIKQDELLPSELSELMVLVFSRITLIEILVGEPISVP